MCLEDKGLLQFQAVFKQMWVTHQVAEWEMGLVPQPWNKIVLLYQHCYWLMAAVCPQCSLHKVKISPKGGGTWNDQQTEPFYWCPPLWAPGFCEIDALAQTGQEHQFSQTAFPQCLQHPEHKWTWKTFPLPNICLFITCCKGSFKLCGSGVVFVVFFLKCPWNAAGHLLQ